MHKTPTRHKQITHKRATPKNDVEKIKAFLRKTTQNFRHGAEDRFNGSLETMKEKSGAINRYLKKRPVKAMSFSLMTGILTGLCIGFYMNNRQ